MVNQSYRFCEKSYDVILESIDVKLWRKVTNIVLQVLAYYILESNNTVLSN